jgi:hypothetical protein
MLHQSVLQHWAKPVRYAFIKISETDDLMSELPIVWGMFNVYEILGA